MPKQEDAQKKPKASELRGEIPVPLIDAFKIHAQFKERRTIKEALADAVVLYLYLAGGELPKSFEQIPDLSKSKTAKLLRKLSENDFPEDQLLDYVSEECNIDAQNLGRLCNRIFNQD